MEELLQQVKHMVDQQDQREARPPAGEPARRSEGEERYVNIGQAAALLGVSRVTVWRWIRAGRLPAIQVGHRTVRIRYEDVARLRTPVVGSGPAVATVRAAAPRRGADAPPLNDAAISDLDHIAQFYEADDALLQAAADFLAAALCAGDAGLVFAAAPHRAAIEERLRRHGLDPDAARAEGRYEAFDAATTLAQILIDGQPQPQRFREVVGGAIARARAGKRRVRVYGEMVSLLATEGNHHAALLLEQQWSALQATLPFTLLCGYPMDAFAGEAFSELFHALCTEHTHVVPTEGYTALPHPDDRLRVIAELQQQARSLAAEIDRYQEVERLLRQQEAALRDFVEQAPIGLQWLGADGTILWANQAQLDLLGYTAEEYIGHSIAEFYVDQNDARAFLTRVAARDTLTNYEARLRCKDGSIKHVLLSANVAREGDGGGYTRCFTIDITPRTLADRRLAVQYAVTRALATTDTLADAAAGILQQVCHSLGWDVGTLWSIDRSADFLRCEGFWHAPDVEAREFEEASRRLRLRPGRGLPGRVWASGQPIWISDVTRDTSFPRAAQAAAAGLHTALAFPISLGDEVQGVLELFSREVRRQDTELLTFMAALGGQIGQFIERKRAEAERATLLERERAARAAAEEQAAVHVQLNAALRELAEERAQALAEVEAARAAAQASERRLHALVANIVDVILVLDAEGRVQYASPTAARVLGYRPEAYPKADAFAFVHPDDRERVRQAFLDALRTPGLHQWMEFRVQHADGSWRVVEAASNVLLDNPDVRGVVVNLRDITERKRVQEALHASEARLRLALDAGQMGTWDWTIDTNTVVWSENLEAIHGLAPGSFGGTFEDFARGVHPADRDRVLAAVTHALQTGSDYRVEYRTLWPDGSLHWLEACGRVLHDETGRPIRMSGVCADVTERKRAEERLAARERQQAAVAQLGQLGLSNMDLDTLFTRAAQAVADTLAVEFVKVLELLPEGTALLLRAGVGWHEGLIGRATVDAGPHSQGGYTLRSGRPVIVEDLEQERRFESSPLLREHGVVSGVSVIIAGRERPFGVLSAHTAHRRAFTEDDVNFLLSVANVLAMAIERRRTLEALREQAETLATVNRIGEILTSELDLERVVQAVTDAATALTGAEFGAFFFNVVNDEGEAFRLYTLSGAPRAAFERFPMPRNTALFGPTFRGEGVIRLDDVTRDPRYGKNPPYFGTPPGHLPVRSYLAVPVISRSGTVLGGLFFGHSRPGVFTQRAEQLAVGLARTAAIAMDNARLYEDARHQARQLALAADIGRALTADAPLQQRLGQCAEALVRHLNAAFARIWTLDPDAQVLELQASAGLYTHLDGAHSRVPVGSLKIGRIARERRPHLTNAVQDDPWISNPDWARREGMVAFAGYPLIVGEQVVGVVALFARHRLAESTLAALASVADSIALAIDRARVERERAQLLEQAQAARAQAEQAARRIARLQAATAALSRARTRGEVTAAVMEQGVAALGASGGVVALLTPDGTALQVVNATGYPAEIVERWACLPLDAALPLTDAVRESDTVLLRSRAERDARYPALRGEPTPNQAWVVVPLQLEERALGAMGFSFATPQEFNAEDRALLFNLARQCSQALERTRLHEAERAARVEAERERQRLQELFQQAPAAIAVLHGPDHTITVVNRLMRELLGPRDLLGRPARVAVPELEGQGFFELLDHVYATGQAEVRTGVRARWLREGAPVDRYFNCVYQPLRDAARRVEGILVHMVEVTDLVHARRQVEALAAERDAFLAAASHDLKTPLTTVKGTAQLLRRWLTRPGHIDHERLVAGLDTINATCNQMLGSINELLDVTRVRLGQPLALERRPTDLVALTRNVVALQQAATDRHRLHLQVAVDTLVGMWDAGRLERVLGNLLSNAVKYSPQGGEVHVAVAWEDDPRGRWAVVRVRDHGVGIPATDLPHIFEPFYRASNVRGRVGGSGIGLAGARRIVEQHGGTISVESREGEGSTFTVRLPLDEAADGQ
jgi:PAS domain S-box-containing protein/excisionase family DNA binding protein